MDHAHQWAQAAVPELAELQRFVLDHVGAPRAPAVVAELTVRVFRYVNAQAALPDERSDDCILCAVLRCLPQTPALHGLARAWLQEMLPQAYVMRGYLDQQV